MGQLLAAIVLVFAWLPSAQAFIVRVSEVGTSNSRSNFSNRGLEEVNLSINRETQIPGSLPPVFRVTRAEASANGTTGALKARAYLANGGGGSLTVSAGIEDTFRIFTSGSDLRPGVSGIGDPNDDLITIRMSGTLIGSAGLGGAAGGIPDFASAFDAGSTRATLSYGLSIGGSFLRATSTSTVSNFMTGAPGSLIPMTETTFTPNANSTILGFTTSTPGAVTMHLDRARYFALTDRRIGLTAALSVFARGGRFPGSEVLADYGNSAYFNLEIEEGYVWLPGIAANRNLLATPAFPTAVPVPPALPLFGAALAGIACLRRRATSACGRSLPTDKG